MSGASKKPPSDKRFKEAYGKALAEALIKNEEYQREALLSTSTSTSNSTLASISVPSEDLEKTYMSFCYDDPIIPADYLCRHLAVRMVGSSFHPNAVKDATGGGISVGVGVDDDDDLKLALSDRFIKGILEASSSSSSSSSPGTDVSKSNKKATMGEEDNDDFTTPYSGEPIVPMSSSSLTTGGQGCAELSFVIFALSPLLSCRILLEHLNLDYQTKSTTESMTIRNIHSFMGSFHGDHEEDDNNNDKKSLFGSSSTTENDNDDQDATNLFLRSMAEMTMSNHQHSEHAERLQLDLNDIGREEKKEKEGEISQAQIADHNDDDDDNSMKEIFAEESDPDDYDYGQDFDRFETSTTTHTATGSGNNANPIAIAYTSSSSSFDAKALSQSKILTVDEIRHRVESLLSNLYHRRICLPTKVWKQWGASKILVDLTLTLLQCLKGGGVGGDENSENNILERLGSMYTKPLIVLRDRCMDVDYGHDAIDDFLDLVTILLKSQPDYVGTYASKNNKVGVLELSPARVIGLSSLSGLCSSNDIVHSPKRRIRTTLRSMIVSSLDEILDCVEFVRPSVVSSVTDTNADTGSTTNIPTWVRVTMALLPILDTITGVKSRTDYSSIHGGDLKPISNTEAQSLLQTGLFRELILLYAQSQNSGGRSTAALAAREVVREQLLRSIFVLSVQSPILAKYAARVPELTSILYTDTFIETYPFDCILWYALLFQTLSRNQGGPQLQLRMRGVGAKTVSKNKTPQELKDTCMNESIQILKNCTNAINDMTTNSNSMEDITLLYEFIRFTNCFHSIPAVGEHWVATISSTNDGTKVARESISHILKSLAKLKPITTTTTTDNQKAEDSTDNTKNDPKDETGKISRRGLDSSAIASIRKGCKTMLLNLENLPNSNSNQARTSFMKASAASSKTD